MTFDRAKTTATFEKLDDRAFSEIDGEARVADLVAFELEGMGYHVERREVRGSRFPQRAAPLVNWLGYGALNSVACAMLLRNNPVEAIVACLLLLLAMRWVFDALSGKPIQWRRHARPLAAAPLLFARAPTESPPAIRVVFQAVLGGIRPDFFHSIRVNRKYIWYVHACFLGSGLLILAAMFVQRPDRLVVLRVSSSSFFVFLWMVVLCALLWEYRQSRLAKERGEVERWGLTALLEIARGWPRTRSREIEAVFLAAGGQRLDYAGSRQVLRTLESEWPRKPSLLVLLFAPGAGERLQPAENSLRIEGYDRRGRDLAKVAAASLWIPVQSDECPLLPLYWPFQKLTGVDPIALVGSDPRAPFDASNSPEALHRTTQLATEIALRWAKQKRAQVDFSQASSKASDRPIERGNETP
jgi:hypothetical protein